MNTSNSLRTNARLQLMKEKAQFDEQKNSQKLLPSANNNVHLWLSKECNLISPTRQDEEDSAYELLSVATESETSLSEVDSFFEDIVEIFRGEVPASSSDFLAASLIEPGTSPHLPHSAISSSCPTAGQNLKNKDRRFQKLNADALDAYKKAKHNHVEKRRRYKIDDCIKELGELLPSSYDIDLNNKKGYILEKSVEYIQKLKKEEEKRPLLEMKQRELEKANRQLMLQVQALQHSLTKVQTAQPPASLNYAQCSPHNPQHISAPTLPPHSNPPESLDPSKGGRYVAMDTLASYWGQEDAEIDEDYQLAFAENGGDSMVHVGGRLADLEGDMLTDQFDCKVMRHDENMMVAHEEEVYCGSYN